VTILVAHMGEPRTAEWVAHGAIDVIASALLAAATVASAWCAYQASVWNGVQTRALATASVAQFASARDASVVNRNVNIDVGVFLRYVEADGRGDRRTTTFLRENARLEFRPALEAWIADQRAGRKDITLPFLRPEYKLAAQDRIFDFDRRVSSDLNIANAANNHSDAFVLHTVLFALSLMFLGATAQARRKRTQLTMLIFGALAFMATFGSMVRLPHAAFRERRMAIPS
jgi:hypothetical protein